MTVTAKALLQPKYAEAATTTQYTSTSVRTIIDKFTATNVTGAVANIAVYVIPSGGTAGLTNLVLQTKALAAGECYVCPELVGQIMEAGDFIATLAGTASAIVIRISGRQIN